MPYTERKIRASELIEMPFLWDWNPQREYVWSSSNIKALKESLERGLNIGNIQVGSLGNRTYILDGVQRITSFKKIAEQGFDLRDVWINLVEYTGHDEEFYRNAFVALNGGKPLARAYLKHASLDGINNLIDECLEKYDFLEKFAKRKTDKVSFLDKCICSAVSGKVDVQTGTSNKAHAMMSKQDIDNDTKQKILSVMDYLEREMVGNFEVEIGHPNYVDLFLFAYHCGSFPSKSQWEETEGLRLRNRSYVKAISYHTTNAEHVTKRHEWYKKTLLK